VQLFTEQAGRLGPLLAETANLFNEPGVGTACRDAGAGQHRFLVVLPYGQGPASRLAVHGLRIAGNVPNDEIAGSQQPLKSLPLTAPEPALPRLQGDYKGLGVHPGVFTTPAELGELPARINRNGSYSRGRFAAFAAHVARDLTSGIDWDAAYSGPDGGVYEYAFSYEPQDGREAEIHDALKLPFGVKAPAGAAVVASRLALYAALANAGATLPPGAPGGAAAAALAKHIILAWADKGFRDARGGFLTLGGFTRDGHGRPDSGLGLELARGAVYSVQAQDLLEGLGALSADEIRRSDALHDEIFELMRQSANVLYAGVGFPFSACSRYTNLETNGMAGMLAVARLRDDRRRLEAVISGSESATPVLPFWTRLFDHLIYGRSDGPTPACVNNHEPDSETALANHHDFQTPQAAPGEIADRFRNAKSGQGVGYPMFTLERLLDSAEILRHAGFDPYAYRGRHGQSLEMALQYYACLAAGAGFDKTITSENAGRCPNAAQYYGRLVNGVDRMILMGAQRFPVAAALTDLEPRARDVARNGAFADDAILFGKWRD
jgi:hypothetical protein